MNTGAPWLDFSQAEARVLAMQTKLHRWATAEPDRCFDDLFNLVYDPAFLAIAWRRVRDNKGGRTAGADGVVPRSIPSSEGFLGQIRAELKSGQFTPSKVREKLIPKGDRKVRRLGIPIASDRVVQASLVLVLEPIFEADFEPCSYGCVAPRMPLLRSTSLVRPIETTIGFLRPISRHVSTTSVTRPYSAECVDESEIRRFSAWFVHSCEPVFWARIESREPR